MNESDVYRWLILFLTGFFNEIMSELNEHLSSGGETAARLYINRIELDINQTGENGDTLLHLAVDSGNLNLVKFLVDEGGDILAQDRDGLLPVQRAAISDSIDHRREVMTYLFRKHAGIEDRCLSCKRGYMEASLPRAVNSNCGHEGCPDCVEASEGCKRCLSPGKHHCKYTEIQK